MSLTTAQKITFTGESTVNGVIVERYRATIDTENPSNVTINPPFIGNQDAYKDYREECYKDQEEFENMVYAAQDEILQRRNNVENLETTDDAFMEDDDNENGND